MQCLFSDAFLLDCRTTSAMNIALWLKFLFAKEDHLMVKYVSSNTVRVIVPVIKVVAVVVNTAICSHFLIISSPEPKAHNVSL